MNNSEQLTVLKAKMIGSKFGLICSGAGVLIAQFIMIEMYSSERSFVHAFFGFMSVSYKLNLFFVVGRFFSKEGNRSIGAQENPFWDYILKPFFWVTLFGIIPSIFVGLMLGFLLKLVAVKHKRL
jgi:uncharacterized membrane protein